jgi:hypothetical protein
MPQRTVILTVEYSGSTPKIDFDFAAGFARMQYIAFDEKNIHFSRGCMS